MQFIFLDKQESNKHPNLVIKAELVQFNDYLFEYRLYGDLESQYIDEVMSIFEERELIDLYTELPKVPGEKRKEMIRYAPARAIRLVIEEMAKKAEKDYSEVVDLIEAKLEQRNDRVEEE